MAYAMTFKFEVGAEAPLAAIIQSLDDVRLVLQFAADVQEVVQRNEAVARLDIEDFYYEPPYIPRSRRGIPLSGSWIVGPDVRNTPYLERRVVSALRPADLRVVILSYQNPTLIKVKDLGLDRVLPNLLNAIVGLPATIKERWHEAQQSKAKAEGEQAEADYLKVSYANRARLDTALTDSIIRQLESDERPILRVQVVEQVTPPLLDAVERLHEAGLTIDVDEEPEAKQGDN